MGHLGLPRRYRRVIQLELNEISRDLIERLVSKGRLPNFRRLLEGWTYIQTESETEYNLLEPWIQWTSAHTGRPFSGHGIFRLSDADRLAVSQIWEVLSQRGVESAIVGSLNAARGDTQGGLFFPDPWTKAGRTYPPQLQGLWDILSLKVQGHATDPISFRQSMIGAMELLKLRLPLAVHLHVAAQVFRQAMDARRRWRLASAFDLFLTSFFLQILKRDRYGFHALFLNSVAHYQHHYWRNHERELFNPNVTSPDCDTNDDPVEYGYERFDRILGAVFDAAQAEDTLVVVASGLSQVPFTAKENEGGMNYYRLKDHAGFVSRLQIPGVEVFPLMSRDWQLRCNATSEFDHAWRTLAALHVSNEKLFRLESNGQNNIFLETAITRGLEPNALIECANGHPIPFRDVFSCIAVKSGHHYDKGSVWLSIPKSDWTPPAKMPVWNLYNIAIEALLGPEAPVQALLDQTPRVRA